MFGTFMYVPVFRFTPEVQAYKYVFMFHLFDKNDENHLWKNSQESVLCNQHALSNATLDYIMIYNDTQIWPSLPFLHVTIGSDAIL